MVIGPAPRHVFWLLNQFVLSNLAAACLDVRQNIPAFGVLGGFGGFGGFGVFGLFGLFGVFGVFGVFRLLNQLCFWRTWVSRVSAVRPRTPAFGVL